MANRHFGKIADVWKHMVLAEVLANDRVDLFCDTHAGHAVYTMITDAERRYGVLGFVELADRNPVLATSTYFRLLLEHGGAGGELKEYPAGPLIALRSLGDRCDYLFCDLDRDSTANIRSAAGRLGLGSCVRVVEGDGVTAVHDVLRDLSPDIHAVVYVDPFDHYQTGPSGLSPLDLCREAARRPSEVIYWYGYNRADRRGWLFDELVSTVPSRNWWCGDVMITSPGADLLGGDLGVATSPGTGFGLVCANVSTRVLARCDELGDALATSYRSAPLPDGRPGGLSYTRLAHRA